MASQYFRRIRRRLSLLSSKRLKRRARRRGDRTQQVEALEDRVLLASTVSLQNGVDGYNGTTDTRIRSDFPTVNFGGSTKLELDGNPDQVTLLKWDVSGIPPGAVVDSASVTVNVINTSLAEFEFYEALVAWNEQNATFEQAGIGQPWQLPGAAGAADRGSEILGSITAPAPGFVTVDLNAADAPNTVVVEPAAEERRDGCLLLRL